MRLLRYLFSHGCFVAICAAVLTAESFFVFSRPVDLDICLLTASLTLCCYNLYRLTASWARIEGGMVFKSVMKNDPLSVCFSVVSALLSVFFVFRSGIFLPWLFIPLLSSFLYFLPLIPRLNKIVYPGSALVKTILLAFTWTFTTVAVPLSGEGILNSGHGWLLMLYRFFFLMVLCIIFDARDDEKDSDLPAGGLFNSISRITVDRLVFGILIAGLFCAGALSLLAGNVPLFAAWGISLIFTALLYRRSFLKPGYFFYYLLVDGMMLFSTVLSYVAVI